MLVRLVTQHGQSPDAWKTIAESFPNRNTKQVRSRAAVVRAAARAGRALWAGSAAPGCYLDHPGLRWVGLGCGLAPLRLVCGPQRPALRSAATFSAGCCAHTTDCLSGRRAVVISRGPTTLLAGYPAAWTETRGFLAASTGPQLTSPAGCPPRAPALARAAVPRALPAPPEPDRGQGPLGPGRGEAVVPAAGEAREPGSPLRLARAGAGAERRACPRPVCAGQQRIGTCGPGACRARARWAPPCPRA